MRFNGYKEKNTNLVKKQVRIQVFFMNGADIMKRFIAAALAVLVTIMSLPVQTNTHAEMLISKKFDFPWLNLIRLFSS